MRLHAAESQILIVDVQERLVPVVAESKDVVANCVLLATAAARLGIPIALSEQYPAGLGHTVPAVLQAANSSGSEATIMEKVEFSCVENDEIRDHLEALRGSDRSQIIIIGVEAHVCVAQTALDLIDEDFDVFVVADAVGSRHAASKNLALRRLELAGAEIINVEMAVFEWLERAGTPEFKELQPLIK